MEKLPRYFFLSKKLHIFYLQKNNIMEFSKEQRTHVRKNVYAFKVTDKNGASFYIDFSGNIEHTTGMTDELEKLFKDITDPDVSYVQQYYDSKEESEKHSFNFKEFDEKSWRNKK